jgi:hypothetical protein
LSCLDGHCSQPRLEGASCSSNDDCAGYLVCLAGACSLPRQKGEPCQSTDQCASDLSCARSGLCTPDRLVQGGEPCGKLPDGTYALCRGGFDCGDDGSCVPIPRRGESCLADGPGCQGGANECREGTCAPLDPNECPIDGPVPMPPAVDRCGSCEADTECRPGDVCGRVTTDSQLGFCVPPLGTTTCCLGGTSGNITTSLCLYVRGELHH